MGDRRRPGRAGAEIRLRLSGRLRRHRSAPVVDSGLGDRASKLLVWDGRSSGAPRTVATIAQRDGWEAAAVLPGGRVLLADPVGLALFDPHSRRWEPEINSYELGFTLAPSGRLAALTTGGGQVEVWDLRKQDAPLLAFTAKGHPTVAWNGSGSLLAVSDPVDGTTLLPALSLPPLRPAPAHRPPLGRDRTGRGADTSVPPLSALVGPIDRCGGADTPAALHHKARKVPNRPRWKGRGPGGINYIRPRSGGILFD